MPTIKNHFTLSVSNGLGYAGKWDHYPSDAEIIEAMQKRFGDNAVMLNGERLTFQVIKQQFLDPHDLTVGDFVEVIQPFYFYDQYFELGERFEMQHQHVKHGFEKFVVKFKK